MVNIVCGDKRIKLSFTIDIKCMLKKIQITHRPIQSVSNKAEMDGIFPKIGGKQMVILRDT